MKTVLFATALLAGSAVVNGVVLIILAMTSGPSVAEGERAVLFAAIAYSVVLLVTVFVYWSHTASLTLMSRILTTGLFVVFECVVVAVMGVITLMVLNR